MKNFIISLIFLGFVPSTYALTWKRYIFEKTDLGQKYVVKDHELSVIYEENIRISEIAQNITVKIFSPSGRGSGVIVGHDDATDEYLVLTSWHVIQDFKNGDEIDIQTIDQKMHSLKDNSIKKIENVDLALIIFQSNQNYKISKIGNINDVKMGDEIFVFGYPLPNKTVNKRLGRLQPGQVTAISNISIEDGYQLLYTNKTLPGMSGGPVLSPDGKLIAIHGRSEVDERFNYEDKLISTGTNMAVPISYYENFLNNKKILKTTTDLERADNYLIKAYQLRDYSEKSIEMLKFAKKSIDLKPTALGYALLGRAKANLSDYKSAKDEFNKALELDPNNQIAIASKVKTNIFSFKNMIEAKENLKFHDKLVDLNPNDSDLLINRSSIRQLSGNIDGALNDLSRSEQLIKKGRMYCKELKKQLKEKNVEIRFSGYTFGTPELNAEKKAIKIKLDKNNCYGPKLSNRKLITIYSRIGNTEFLRGNTPKACNFWEKVSSMQSPPLLRLPETEGYRFALSLKNISEIIDKKVYSIYGWETYNKEVSNDEKEFIRKIDKDMPLYFQRSVELYESDMKGITTNKMIYKYCL